MADNFILKPDGASRMSACWAIEIASGYAKKALIRASENTVFQELAIIDVVFIEDNNPEEGLNCYLNTIQTDLIKEFNETFNANLNVSTAETEDQRLIEDHDSLHSYFSSHLR
jgi:hypothetical protein